MMTLFNLRRTMALTASLLGTVVISSQSSAHAKLTGDDDDHLLPYTLKGESNLRTDILMNKTAKKDAASEDALEGQNVALESSLSEQVIQAAKKAKNRLDANLNDEEPSAAANRQEASVTLKIRHNISIADGSMVDEALASFAPLSTEPSILDHWFDQGVLALKKYFS